MVVAIAIMFGFGGEYATGTVAFFNPTLQFAATNPG